MANIHKRKFKLLKSNIKKSMVSQLIKEVTIITKNLVHSNQLGDFRIPEGTNRESYRQAIEAHIKIQSELDRTLKMPNTNRRFIK